MAQFFPDSPQVIFDTLVADPTIQSFLGKYTFNGSNTEVPAISILTPGADLPNTRTCNGVEVIIHDVADMRRRDYITGPGSIESTWNVYVICWDPATGDDVTGLVRRAMEMFSGSLSFQTVATAEGVGAMVQTQLQIPSDMPILA